mgnify:FL=1
MKKSIKSSHNIVFLFFLTLCISHKTLASSASQEIVEVGKIADEYGGGRVFQIDSSVQEPNDFNKITGLKLNVTLNKMGSFSGAMPTSMMIITKGAHQGSEYIFTYPDSFPVYDLANKELVVLGVGPSAFICPMAFKYGKALEETFSEGETRTLTFEGNRALFTNDSSIMTIVYFTGDFTLNSIEWIKGEIIPEPDISWEKVEKKVFTDIETVNHEKQNGNNYIDITVPANREGPFQVIFWIHGGGWQSMSRKSCILDDTKEYLLYCGYAFVSAEYTLVNHTDGRSISPKLGMIHDLKAAVRFIRANAKKYNLNTNYIVAMGESAGGHLALLMGTTNGNPKHEDLSMGNSKYSSYVHLAAGYFAPTTFLVTNTSSTEDITMSYALLGDEVLLFNDEIMELEKQMSPSFMVSKNTVPLFITHSRADGTVPFHHSQKMYEAAKEYLNDNDLKTIFYNKGGHGDRSTFDTASAYVAVSEFISSHNPDNNSNMANKLGINIYFNLIRFIIPILFL